MKVVYLMTTTIQIKQHQLGLEVEGPEQSTTFSFISLFYTIKEMSLVFRRFF